jgi:hypothetical protein
MLFGIVCQNVFGTDYSQWILSSNLIFIYVSTFVLDRIDLIVLENIWIIKVKCLFFQRLPFVDVATGSLGQGLSCAVGMAYMGKYVDKTG